MEGGMPPYAWEPEPEDGDLHADTWVTLRWKADLYAVSHDVYLGDDFDIVDGTTRDSAEQVQPFLSANQERTPWPLPVTRNGQ